jgi:hypothetical protein
VEVIVSDKIRQISFAITGSLLEFNGVLLFQIGIEQALGRTTPSPFGTDVALIGHMHKWKSAAFILAFLMGTHAQASPLCKTATQPHIRPAVTSFMEKSFYNGGLLMEFFGPQQNTLSTWLKWLESDDLNAKPAAGPGLYIGSGKYILAKDMEYPIDAGVNQFKNSDVSNRHIVSLAEFSNAEVQNMRGSSDAAKKARELLMQRLDMQIFGIYGALQHNTAQDIIMRSIGGDHTLSASIYPRIQFHATHNWVFENPEDVAPGNPLEDLKKVAQIVSDTDDMTVLKIPLGYKPQNRNQEVIQKMFFITHWQMVQKAYRETGLFPDEFKTATNLLDGFIETMKTSDPNQDIYLAYDPQAIDSMGFRMSVANQYVSIHMQNAGWQPYYYQTIADVFYPFYPIFGMAVEKYPNGERELKRLFRNDNPDPLNLLREPYSNKKSLIYEFYRDIIKPLPAGSPLVVSSKTPVHTRIHKSMGFTLDHSEFIPEWNATKDTLKGTRESFLTQIEARLKGSEK